jgi:hypothetical protein
MDGRQAKRGGVGGGARGNLRFISHHERRMRDDQEIEGAQMNQLALRSCGSRPTYRHGLEGGSNIPRGDGLTGMNTREL